MPSVRYNVTGYDQTGPTCWFYASKMLLDFHDMIGSGQQLEQEFKALEEITDATRGIASRGEQRTVPAIQRELTTRLNTTLDESHRQTLRQARLGIQSSASTDRFELVVAGLGKQVIKPLSLGGASFDIDFVVTSLQNHGPLYCSTSGFDWYLGGDLVNDPMGRTDNVWSFSGAEQNGGRHAVVLAGANTTTGNIYLKDPQCAHRFTVIPWDDLKGSLNSPGGSMGNSLFGYVDCQGCQHLNRTV